jgi:hypothetical protein
VSVVSSILFFTSVPTQISFVWLNWIIVRCTMVLPNQYLLQFNTFLFEMLGWGYCQRIISGGMNGPELPYRIYVDSGTVFLCIVGLGFASPLVTPVALAYYLIAVPLLRRNSIFVYRPKYDGGGFRFPYLSDIFITSMCLGQVSTLYTTQAQYTRHECICQCGQASSNSLSLFAIASHCKYAVTAWDHVSPETSSWTGTHSSVSIRTNAHFSKQVSQTIFEGISRRGATPDVLIGRMGHLGPSFTRQTKRVFGLSRGRAQSGIRSCVHCGRYRQRSYIVSSQGPPCGAR